MRKLRSDAELGLTVSCLARAHRFMRLLWIDVIGETMRDRIAEAQRLTLAGELDARMPKQFCGRQR